ncbi:transposase family protein [Gammaproteobacteria bacterium]|nr:transposase family protein [Gammaproteobacteria bacterium]
MLSNTKSPVTHSIYRNDLKKKIHLSQKQIRENIESNNTKITHRTQARNRKSSPKSLAEEQAARQNIMGEQIKAWRSMLPILIKKFSRIQDPRRAKSVKHKIVVLMIFGLFAFVFRLSSRREINRELTGAIVYKNLCKIFPEINSIPHADTLARLFERLNVKEIESAHIELIKKLIYKKKFKKLLINGCLPISVDGAQKLFRNGLLNDSHWLQRKVGRKNNQITQQYVYAIEANITLKNGLNIPLLTEYLHMENNQLINNATKQDSELRAFERISEKLKKHFPRLKIMMFMDALYATQGVMETCISMVGSMQ